MFELVISPFTMLTWFVIGIQVGQSLFGDSSHKNYMKVGIALFTITSLMSLYNLWLRHL